MIALSGVLAGCGFYSDLSRVDDVSRERVQRVTEILKQYKNRNDARYEMADVIFYAFANNAQLTLLQSQLDENYAKRLRLGLADLPIPEGTWSSKLLSRPSTDEGEFKHTQTAKIAMQIDAVRLFLNQSEKYKTDADRKILNLRLRDTFNNLAMEALANYAFIVHAKSIKATISKQLQELKSAKDKSALLASTQLQDPLISLSYRNGIQTLSDSLRGLEAQVRRAELSLMSNLSYQFGGELLVSPMDASRFISQIGKLQRDKAVMHALQNRSDLKVGDYNVYQSELDLEGAMWSFLPSVTLDAAFNVDSSRAPVDRRNYTGSVSVTLPLLKLLTQPYIMEVAEQKKLQSELQAIARNLAAVAEIDLMRVQLRDALSDLMSANETLKTRNEILTVREGRAIQSEQDELDLIRTRAEAVEAGLRTLNAKTMLFQAALQVYVGAGYDLFPGQFLEANPMEIADKKSELLPHLKTHLNGVLQGELRTATVPDHEAPAGSQ